MVNPMTEHPTDEELFAQICDHAQTIEYLLQFAIQRMPQEANVAAYLLRVSKRHVGEMVSFARTGLSVNSTPEQRARIEREPDFILAQRATTPAA